MHIQIDAEIPLIYRHAQKQAPFAAALALTLTAKDGQEDVRASLPSKFKLRNTWTARNICFAPASKTTLEARVTAPDYLALQETGGTKTPVSGTHIGIPNRQALGDGILRASKRPRGLLEKKRVFLLTAESGKRFVAQRTSRKSQPIRILYALERSQNVEPIFGMFETVLATVDHKFAMRFDEALQRAIATAR